MFKRLGTSSDSEAEMVIKDNRRSSKRGTAVTLRGIPRSRNVKGTAVTLRGIPRSRNVKGTTAILRGIRRSGNVRGTTVTPQGTPRSRRNLPSHNSANRPRPRFGAR
jgi:hypothetical protein